MSCSFTKTLMQELYVQRAFVLVSVAIWPTLSTLFLGQPQIPRIFISVVLDPLLKEVIESSLTYSLCL